MRPVLAIIVSTFIFLFCWLLIAGLLALMLWVAVKTEHASTLFLLFHAVVIWILRPAVCAALAIFATASSFRTVAPSTIFVGFISVLAVLLFGLVVLGAASSMDDELPNHHLVVMFFQIVAIFLGARIGLFFAEVRRIRETPPSTRCFKISA